LTQGPVAVGELGRAADYTMSVEAVRDCPVTGALAPKRGLVKVGLDVALEGTSAREVPANAFYASLRSLAGEAYSGTLTGCEPALPSVRLTQGAKARGHVVFEVPRTAMNLELRYAAPVIGGGVEELRFTIQR
jgi:hypothetical protein